ncbi:MAG: DUF4175 domain-containing protein [Saprospiraceae bacterium]|nr:DUF4175 domain-containing protein [Candidatus Brachybacter algidus]
MEKEALHYNLLIQRLDQFIRKYYLNQIIRGFLYLTGFVTVYFITIALLENYFYFGTTGRKVLFYSFLAASLFTLFKWILVPGAKYFKLGATITKEKAATIIGSHFPNVQDKLLNVLQLSSQAHSGSDSALIIAGIEQKTKELQPVSFKNAIDLNNNRRYLKYAVPPVLALLVLLFAAPSLIRKPVDRLLQNNKEFEREAPFTFNLVNKNLNVAEFDSYVLEVKLEGNAIPDQLDVVYNETPYRLTKDSKGVFSYTFANVQDDINFQLKAAGFNSKPYELNVLKKAGLTNLQIKLDYPAYVGRKDEVMQGSGDLVVPFGTKIYWEVQTRLANKVTMSFEGNATANAQPEGADKFTFLKTAINDQNYKILIGNDALPHSDSLAYSIHVVQDEYPVITLEKYADSTNQKLVYLSGNVSDDYGLTKLNMVQQIRSEDGKVKTRVLAIPKPQDKQGFYSYLFDIESLKLNPGDDMTYYFEVFDNDAVKGAKSSKTSVMTFKKPSVKEMEKNIEQSTKEIQSELQKTLNESKKINEAINKLKEKLLQQKSLNWQDKEQLNKLLEKQKELQEKLKETQEKLEEKRKNEEEIKPPSPEIKEKQDKLDEMLKELQDPEEQKIMDKIKELMDKLDKKESMQQLEKMSQQTEQKNKNLDRLMELMKQLELENKVEDTADKLDELAKKEEKLADEAENDKKDAEQLKKEQEEVKKDFEDVKKKMEEIQKENKELQAPKKLDDQKEQQEKTDQDLQKSEESLDKKDKKSASKSQKSAAKKMKDMAKSMKNDMAASDQEQIELDMKAVRQLLENIIGLSFNQEGLLNQFNATAINTPKYVSLTRDQMKIKNDFKMVDDSLVALSKRVYQIETFILKKVGEINTNLDQSMDNLEERLKPVAANNQQLSMTNLNDLALMLSEVMEQMQQQASSSMPGSQMCNKPGGTGSPKEGKEGKDGKEGKEGNMPQMDKITQGQQKMNEAMKESLGKMKKGEKPGSEGFGGMAAEQAKVRKALQDIDSKMKQNGQGKKQIQDIIDAMDQIEKDLVNKRLTNEMITRQEQIMVRLLEEERAQRSQEQDEKRKASQAIQQQSKVPASMQEYIKKREANIDEFRPVYPALTPYYKRLVEQYYNQLSGK